MALAARNTKEQRTVDRQTKIDGDENMMRVHKMANTDDDLTASERLNISIEQSNYVKTKPKIFSAQKYLTDIEC
jgi:hypothetical protein